MQESTFYCYCSYIALQSFKLEKRNSKIFEFTFDLVWENHVGGGEFIGDRTVWTLNFFFLILGAKDSKTRYLHTPKP